MPLPSFRPLPILWRNLAARECPIASYIWVDVMRADGSVDYARPAGDWNWQCFELQGRDQSIISWRYSSFHCCGNPCNNKRSVMSIRISNGFETCN